MATFRATFVAGYHESELVDLAGSRAHAAGVNVNKLALGFHASKLT